MNDSPILVDDWCETCRDQRFFVVQHLEASYLLRCMVCGTVSSSVWCSQCGMGGDFVKDLANKPAEWECPQCHRRYELTSHFYNSPVDLIREQDIPQNLRHQLPTRSSRTSITLQQIDSTLSSTGRLLGRPFAVIFILGFIALLSMHLASLLTRSSFFPFPTVFLILAFLSFIIGIDPTYESTSIKEYYRKYLRPIHPLLRWFPFLILVYSLCIYLVDLSVAGGRSLSSIPSPAREDAIYMQLLCIQGVLMAIILLGGLITWHRYTGPRS